MRRLAGTSSAYAAVPAASARTQEVMAETVFRTAISIATGLRARVYMRASQRAGRNDRTRRFTIGWAWIALCVASTAVAQSSAPARPAQPSRPPLFFSEGWKALPGAPDDH